MSDIMLSSAAALDIRDGNTLYHGGDQAWFPDHWQRQAGCGPTNCCNLLWHLAQTAPGCGALCPYDATQKQGFIQLMKDVWRYVTPGRMGVNTTKIFTDGATRYGRDKDVPLIAESMEVPPILGARPTFAQVTAFVGDALRSGVPVAFLNLSNGCLQNLDSWHWITLVGLRGRDALAYDQGEAKWIDLEAWLHTTAMGGGVVVLRPSGGLANGQPLHPSSSGPI